MERLELFDVVRSVRADNFVELALQVYDYQYRENRIYRKFVDTLMGIRGIDPSEFDPQALEEIPYLPIGFFKTEEVKTGEWMSREVYKSSATTGSVRSHHHVRDMQLYLDQSLRIFTTFYGDIKDYTILALLPGYLDREGSSLVSMAKHFIDQTNSPQSGFYLRDLDGLLTTINDARKTNKKILLLGVSFALWELAERNLDLHDVIIMETGGMKGKGPELPKAAFHDFLMKGLNVSTIHSEYGMTELLSQGYSTGDTIFKAGNTMHILTTETTDPFTFMPEGKAGVINIVDLMNIDSCAFIATQDLGICRKDGSFQLLGRLDDAEIRGCNLLVSDL